MIGNFGKSLPDPSDSEGYRQKIVAIAYTISTTMPGQIDLGTLKGFEEQIIGAIESLRASKEPCKNKYKTISHLEDAKIPLQMAIDDIHPGGNRRRRYQNIADFGRTLEEALKYW